MNVPLGIIENLGGAAALLPRQDCNVEASIVPETGATQYIL
jgi:hypothetical protein